MLSQNFLRCEHGICALSGRLLPGLVAILVLAAVTRADGPVSPGLYVPPANPFIVDPAETPIVLNFGPASISDIQAQLDAARASDPSSPIVLTLTGTYTVTDAPLSLPSITSLVLYGTIAADPNATATSLISINGQTKVGISGGILNGNGVNLAGIDAESSVKVEIDAVTITSTGQDGIVLSGNGNNIWGSGSAITRCEVTQAGGNGLTIRNITQALVLDTFVHANAGAGIQLSAAHSSIVNDVIRQNSDGITVTSNDNLISDNELRGNGQAGLRLTNSSSGTAVLRNIIADNGVTGADLDGNNNLIYSNTFSNATDLTDRVSRNWVVPRVSPLTAPVSNYFYPPTIGNQHSDLIMNGLGRADVSIDAASFPTIADVQQAYDDAQQQNPGAVLVLHMSGDFMLTGGPLVLQSNTAVVLSGTIHVASTTAHQAITAGNPVSFLALSGGTIDCGGRVMEGITIPSATMADIDSVTVTHCGVQNPRSTSNAIHFQGGHGYNILRANTVDVSGGRCIWTQSSSPRYVVLENQTSHCNEDGVDFDSSTSNSLAIGNVSVDNQRYGVFVEQSDSSDKVYGNFTTTRGLGGTSGHGIGVYNNSTTDGQFRAPTQKNTVFSNVADTAGDSLRVGSTGNSDVRRAETAHNFFFNNTASNVRTGIQFDAQGAGSIDNYFSQTVLSGNNRDINANPTLGAAPPDFFNPMPAVSGGGGCYINSSMNDFAAAAGIPGSR